MKCAILGALCLIGAIGLTTLPANAQATRTWVSGVGDDANPCSRTAPCKTFAGAISKTADGGEISVLDPGGFGAVTITKSITLNGDGTLAGILAASTNGIIINAAAGKDVLLRNISINGVGGSTLPGLNGIRFLAGGSLTLQNVNIYGFSQSCIDIAITAGTGPITEITNSNLSACATGINVSNTTTGQRAIVNVNHSKISDVTNGINAARQAGVTLDDVTISGATTTGIIVASAGVAPASEVNIRHSLITNSALGLGINSAAIARLDDASFAENTKATSNGGSCETANNNKISGFVAASTGPMCTAMPLF
jgi:hypothetical protein